MYVQIKDSIPLIVALCLVDFLEHLLRLGVVGVLVRVVLERQAAVLFLDFLQ